MTASRALSISSFSMSAGRRIFLDFAQIFVALLHPFLKSDLLVLQSMSQFVSHDRFLLFDRYPVEQVHRLRLRIVVARDFFAQQRRPGMFRD